MSEPKEDRRRSPRSRTLKKARIVFNNRRPTMDCVVRRNAPSAALSDSDLANEKRCGADQCTVVDLLHEEVRDVRTADRAGPPVL